MDLDDLEPRKQKPKPRVGILGLGRLGSALHRSLRDAGYPTLPRGKEAREKEPDPGPWVALSQVLCLAVRDDQIERSVSMLAPFPMKGKTVLIHAGSAPLRLLAPLAARGAIIGKLHPLQSFSQARDHPIPAGTHFAIEGDIEPLAKAWVEAWRGHLHVLSEDQWLVYHLAAVLSANFLPLFIRSGASLLEPMTSDPQAALDWLAPLIRESVDHGLDAKIEQPFSGPAVRGDQHTIEAHEKHLAAEHPHLKGLYQLASRLIRELAATPKNR